MRLICRNAWIDLLLLSVLSFKDVFRALGNQCDMPKPTYNGVIFEKLGCWEDTGERALNFLGNFYTDPLYNCYKNSTYNMFEIFSIQYGFQCFAGNGLSYQRFGRSNRCNANGRGGGWSNEVYKVNKNSLDVNKTAEFRNVLKGNCTSLKTTATNSASDSCNKRCFWSNNVCINEDECYICTCDISWALGKDVLSCVKNCHKPQLNFAYSGVMIESFLYTTFHIKYKNFDELAFNVTWEYLFPPFIRLQSLHASSDFVYNDPNSFQYKVMILPDNGINQSISAIIDNTSCFVCQTYIDIPMNLYFENTAGISWKSNQIIRKILTKNCSHIVQNQSPNINCIRLCVWTSNICIDGEECYTCTCELGWRLNKDNYSCVDIDECTAPSKSCNWANSVCINNQGSYMCTCESGWYLSKNNDKCIDVNECTGSLQPCNWTNSFCTNTNGSYICTCEAGWLLGKKNNSCVDVDECMSSNQPCNLTNSVCTNTNGSYICTCKSGWLLDNNSKSCVDVDECMGLNYPCNWTNSVCTNTYGSFLCTCESGWLLSKNNNSCVDVDECTGLNYPCNWTNSFCTNIYGSFLCTCESGWLLSKNNNSCVDECTSLSKPCNLNNNVCVNINGKYECIEGEWNIWGECSKTCGLGYKDSYLRTMLSSYKDVKRVETCMNFMCPGDSNWSTWINYETFTNSCGVCFTRRERFCSNSTPKNAYNGYDCFGLNLDYQFNETDTICPVHGGWTQWSLWSLCNQACLGGIQTRHRSCTNPIPKYNGLKCNGNETEHNLCSSNKCKKVAVNLNIIFKDVGYQGVYFDPTNEPSKMLKNIIQNAIQNLHNKFNKSVQFDLVLNLIKDGENNKLYH